MIGKKRKGGKGAGDKESGGILRPDQKEEEESGVGKFMSSCESESGQLTSTQSRDFFWGEESEKVVLEKRQQHNNFGVAAPHPPSFLFPQRFEPLPARIS